jgi:hypothetical protein
MRLPVAAVVAILVRRAVCVMRAGLAGILAAVLLASSASAATRSCGTVRGPGDGTDYPTLIRATGVGCKTARAVAADITIRGHTRSHRFRCPTARVYAQRTQRCTRGRAVIWWRVVFA